MATESLLDILREPVLRETREEPRALAIPAPAALPDAGAELARAVAD